MRLKNAWEISVYNLVDKILNTIVYLSVSETGSSTGEEWVSNNSFGQSMRSNYRIGFPIALQEQYCEQLLHCGFYAYAYRFDPIDPKGRKACL